MIVLVAISGSLVAFASGLQISTGDVLAAVAVSPIAILPDIDEQHPAPAEIINSPESEESTQGDESARIPSSPGIQRSPHGDRGPSITINGDAGSSG